MNAETSDGDYRVAIFNQFQDLHELSIVFQDVLQIHPTDAMVWSRHMPGILTKSFSEVQAAALIAAISALGLRVHAIHKNEIPSLLEAVIVYHARCEENGLQLFEPHGLPDAIIPWAEIQMICVGEVPAEISRHYSPGPAIQQGASEDELRRVIRATHSPSLAYDALTKARDGTTSLDEARSLCWV